MSFFENKVVQKDLSQIVQNIKNIEQLKSSSVLITGATGMIATYITNILLYLNEKENYNIEIFALVRSGEKARQKFGDFVENPNFNLLVQDVTEEIKISKNIDYIIHAAGSASPHFIVNEPVGIIKANTLRYNEYYGICKKM